MNMVEALAVIAKPGVYLWARPKSWHLSGQAICREGNGWKTVPDRRGGRTALIPSVAATLGEWETVAPGVVCREL